MDSIHTVFPTNTAPGINTLLYIKINAYGILVMYCCPRKGCGSFNDVQDICCGMGQGVCFTGYTANNKMYVARPSMVSNGLFYYNYNYI